MLATTEFEELARESAHNEGIAPARVITVTHPIGGASDAALADKAEAALEAVLALSDASD